MSLRVDRGRIADPMYRLTNPLLLIALGFLAGGFAAINKFGM